MSSVGVEEHDGAHEWFCSQLLWAVFVELYQVECVAGLEVVHPFEAFIA